MGVGIPDTTQVKVTLSPTSRSRSLEGDIVILGGAVWRKKGGKEGGWYLFTREQKRALTYSVYTYYRALTYSIYKPSFSMKLREMVTHEHNKTDYLGLRW